MRLLPWPGPDGKEAYLSTDNPDSVLSRAADEMEEVHLGMAQQLIVHADKLLAETPESARELRALARCLTCSLRDTLRVAESRGGCLTAYREQREESG